MPLFGRRSNTTPKKERRSSKPNVIGSTTSTPSSPPSIKSSPKVKIKATSKRSPSPFRLRRKDKQVQFSEETDSETSSITIHKSLQQQRKLEPQKSLRKESPLRDIFKRKSKKPSNDDIDIDIDKTTPISNSRKSIHHSISSSSNSSYQNEKKSSSSSVLPSSSSSLSSNTTHPSIFISSASARTIPKGKHSRKNQLHEENPLNSPSTRTVDSIQTHMTSSSLLQYPPSKLPSAIDKSHPSSKISSSSSTRMNSTLSRVKQSYQSSTDSNNDNDNIELSDSIRFDDDGDDNDENETKSVDTQQYAEYQNVIFQLKAKMLRDKDEHERRQREFDLMDGIDEHDLDGNDGNDGNDDHDDHNQAMKNDSNNSFQNHAKNQSRTKSQHNREERLTSLSGSLQDSSSSTTTTLQQQQSLNNLHHQTAATTPTTVALNNSSADNNTNNNHRHHHIIDVTSSRSRITRLNYKRSDSDFNLKNSQGNISNFVQPNNKSATSAPTNNNTPSSNNSINTTSYITNQSTGSASKVKKGQPPIKPDIQNSSIELNYNLSASTANTTNTTQIHIHSSTPPRRTHQRPPQGPTTPPLAPSQPPSKSQSTMSASLRRKARYAASQNNSNHDSNHNHDQQQQQQQQHNHQQPKPQERRRNFAFMKSSSFSSSTLSTSPQRRKISNATLEKTRAHSKKLAKLAYKKSKARNENVNSRNSHVNGNNDNTTHAGGGEGDDDDDSHFANFGEQNYHFNAQFDHHHHYHPQSNNIPNQNNYEFAVQRQEPSSSLSSGTPPTITPVKPQTTTLNFAAFETDSCISANTSVYDMDFIDHMPSFDDTVSTTSFFSSVSSFSGVSGLSAAGAGAGGSYMNSNHNSMKQIPIHHHHHQQQHHHHQQSWGKSKNKLDMYSGVGNNHRRNNSINNNNNSMRRNHDEYSSPQQISTYQHNHQSHSDFNNGNNLNRSNLSTVSNGSSISGPAARRLMRRGLSQHMMQQNLASSTNANSNSNNNQYGGSGGSVNSGRSDNEGSAGQYSAFETPQKTNENYTNNHQHQHQQQSSMTKSKSNAKNDDRPPLSPVPFLHDGSAKPSRGSVSSQKSSSQRKSSSRSSSSSSTSRKKKIHIESTGFTFDAFGLDANEIDNEVNEAMKELADSNLDLSLFALGSNGDDNYSASSGSSSVIARMNHKQQQQQQQQKEMNEQLSSDLDGSSSSILAKRHFSNSSSNGGASVQSSEEKKAGTSALREKFKTAHLPDITPDNVSVKAATNDHGDFNLSSVLALSDEFMSKPSSNDPDKKLEHVNDLHPSWQSDFGIENNEDVDENNESSNSSDSGEVQEFQPRKPAGSFQPQSESQKRAQEWAAQRTAPILVSPLLVPKKIVTGKDKKDKKTFSQKRAQEWAHEAPRSSHGHQDTSPQQVDRKQLESMSPTVNNSASSRKHLKQKWLEAPPPSPPPIEEDLERENHKPLGNRQSNPRPPIQVQVPPPVENVVLRTTDSPGNEGKVDYERFKSSAPSVPLRKVDIPPRPNKPTMETNTSSFLSSVKLRKTNSPISQAESSPSNQVQADEISEYDTYVQDNEYDDHNEVREQIRHENVPYNYAEEAKPTQKPKLTYREQRELQLREEKAKRQSQITAEQKPPDVEALIKKRIAANRQNLMRNNTVDANNEKKDEIDIPSLRTKLRPPSPRQPEVAEPTVKETPSPRTFNHKKLLPPNKDRNATIVQEPSLNETEELKAKSIPKFVIQQPIGTGQVPPNIFDERESEGTSEKAMDSVHKVEENSVAALFAKRSAMLNVNIQTDQSKDTRDDELEESKKSEPSMNNVAALFAKRAEAMQPPRVHEDEPKEEEVKEYEAEEVEEPSINNVAALFQKRSQMMSGSAQPSEKPKKKNTGKKAIANDDLNESSDSLAEGNSKLLEMLGKKSGAMQSKKEKHQDDMIIVGDTAVKETESSKTAMNPALKDDPAYAKYFKMLKMGLPMEVVKHAMARDGVDASLMDGDHSKPADSMDSGVPLKEDPKYAKYFKMIKMGLPMGAVKNAMERDGENPSIMDGDHNLPASSNSKQKGAKSPQALPKDKYRRTRLHWDTLRQVRSTSVWAQINQDPDVKQIEIDENEFAELFQSERGKDISKDTDTGKKRNAVKVIDPKRANNGGIILARLKITYEEMAVAIDRIDETAMTLEQMQGIVEYIPNKEEKIALRKYMTSSDKESADAFDELCECEKFMVAMMTVKHSKEKVRAILFKQQFKQCIDELGQDVMSVEKSCDELRNSVRLRKLLGIVLNIGNRLNTAGQTRKGKAGAFTIESLLKLSQAKAFDKKTTFLHYIVMVVKRNNESLIDFKKDIPSVLKSDKIYWDQCESDLEEVENQLENVRKISLHEVYGKNQPKWARQKKGKDDDDMSQESMSLEAEVEALRSTQIGLFTLHAIKIVSSLREHVEKTKVKFFKLLEYFGEEDKKKMNPHELFVIMVNFSRDFDAALEEVAKIEKQKKKAAQKKNGTRTLSPSSRSKDSSSRDEECSTQSGHSPKRPQEISNENPASVLRISSHQPHVVSKPRVVAVVKPSPQVPSPVKAAKPAAVLEYTMDESAEHMNSHINPASPQQQYSDDCESSSRGNSEFSNEKNHSNKTMMTSETSVSGSESQDQHLNMVGSDYSKEGCDENAAPSNFSHKDQNHTPNDLRVPTPQSQLIDDNFDDNINSSSNRQTLNSHSPPRNDSRMRMFDVPTSVSTHTKQHPDQQSTKKPVDKQSMREKARAMKHQRMASQRSSSRQLEQLSPKKLPPKNTKDNSVHNKTPLHQHHPLPTEYRTNTNSPSHHLNQASAQSPQQTQRRKPPSPEDLRQRTSSQSSSPSLSSAQQRIRARRERIDRRRRIES